MMQIISHYLVCKSQKGNKNFFTNFDIANFIDRLAYQKPVKSSASKWCIKRWGGKLKAANTSHDRKLKYSRNPMEHKIVPCISNDGCFFMIVVVSAQQLTTAGKLQTSEQSRNGTAVTNDCDNKTVSLNLWSL